MGVRIRNSGVFLDPENFELSTSSRHLVSNTVTHLDILAHRSHGVVAQKGAVTTQEKDCLPCRFIMAQSCTFRNRTSLSARTAVLHSASCYNAWTDLTEACGPVQDEKAPPGDRGLRPAVPRSFRTYPAGAPNLVLGQLAKLVPRCRPEARKQDSVQTHSFLTTSIVSFIRTSGRAS